MYWYKSVLLLILLLFVDSLSCDYWLCDPGSCCPGSWCNPNGWDECESCISAGSSCAIPWLDYPYSDDPCCGNSYCDFGQNPQPSYCGENACGPYVGTCTGSPAHIETLSFDRNNKKNTNIIVYGQNVYTVWVIGILLVGLFIANIICCLLYQCNLNKKTNMYPDSL
eukprot:87643_1